MNYKILASTLAAKLNKVLVDYVHHDQSGLVKNRYLKDNIRNLMNIINYTHTFVFS